MPLRSLPPLLCFALLLAGCGASTTSTATTTTLPTAVVAETPVAPTEAAIAAPAASATAAAAATVEATDVAAAPEKCADVEAVSAPTPEGDALVQALIAATPALAQSAAVAGRQVRQINRVGDWAVIEAEFPNAEPGIFVLKKSGATYTSPTVWGGVPDNTQQIRDYLAQNAPGAPAELFACFEPQGAPFNPEAH